MDISSLDDCLNFAYVSLHVCDWPIVGRPCEWSEAESFYSLTEADPVPSAYFMFPPILTPLTNGYPDLRMLNVNEAPFLQMSWYLRVICNRAIMPSRRVEQVRIPVFECFSLTTKSIIVTARHQIYFDMLDVANARFEVSILFFSSAVYQQLRI